MSRSLLGFLLFCLVLAAATAGVVWYVGPSLAAIVIDGDRRENPYYLLQLLPTAAVTGDVADPSYRASFVTLAAEDEAVLLWQGGHTDVVQGSVLLEVGGAQVLQFPSGADLVQVLTSTAYRTLDRALAPDRVRHLGTGTEPLPLGSDLVSVVVLYRVGEAGGRLPLGRAGEAGWLGLLPDYGGRVRWDAPITVIGSAESWNRVLLLQFPDAAAAEGWLGDPLTVTERAIAARYVDELTVLVVQPGAFSPR